MNRTQPHVPALDATPTGRALPYIPEPPREHPENTPARIALADGVTPADLIAALPDVCDQAMKAAMPERYTPELAAQFAAAMATFLRQEQETSKPLSAAERGTEWMNRWGCPGFCVEEHGKPGAMECHSTAPVESSILAADLDCSGYSENGEGLPWMTAQVIVHNDKPAAYGRSTQVWIGYGVHLAEVSPAKAREALDAMRGFVSQLETVVMQAEQSATADFPGDPEVARLDREAEQRRVHGITGDQPGGAR
ncbi:hypothetical protein [Streptomyces sp. NPDC086787]|uniref:hypothetical protein n=1 Tax=Streptomyces sp. NPDC086787 TaxID=3365759 RepID=UPI0038141417